MATSRYLASGVRNVPVTTTSTQTTVTPVTVWLDNVSTAFTTQWDHAAKTANLVTMATPWTRTVKVKMMCSLNRWRWVMFKVNKELFNDINWMDPFHILYFPRMLLWPAGYRGDSVSTGESLFLWRANRTVSLQDRCGRRPLWRVWARILEPGWSGGLSALQLRPC